jgi:hypothetical protein
VYTIALERGGFSSLPFIRGGLGWGKRTMQQLKYV